MSMKEKTFPRLISTGEESCDEIDAMNNLKDKVYSLTIRQGTACWHWGRKFSLTSSQGHFTFIHAFELYKNRPHWRNVALHLYGPDWKRYLKVSEEDDSTDETERSSSQADAGDQDTGEYS